MIVSFAPQRMEHFAVCRVFPLKNGGGRDFYLHRKVDRRLIHGFSTAWRRFDSRSDICLLR